MTQQPGSEDALVLSYLGLRKAIGVIGIALPFVLAFGNMLLRGFGIQKSISDYYYTGMRDVFVGSLCAIAVFLMSYRGYERKDAIAGKLACIFAVCVAFFPTAPDVAVSSLREKFIGGLHLFFAALFFLTLAYFSLVLFRKTDPSKPPTPQKLRRNAVYSICGYAILASIVLIVVVKNLLNGLVVMRLEPVFWLESLSVVAFGVSWLVKGEALLKDEV